MPLKPPKAQWVLRDADLRYYSYSGGEFRFAEEINCSNDRFQGQTDPCTAAHVKIQKSLSVMKKMYEKVPAIIKEEYTVKHV